jgi:hypothetical protein
MAVTFNADLSDPVSRVRQLIGDTDPAAALVQDETITAYLATRGETATAAQLARDLSMKFARKVDTTVDGQGVQYSQASRRFAELAVQLEAQAKREAASTPALSGADFCGIFVGGATASEVLAQRVDPTHPSNVPPPGF